MVCRCEIYETCPECRGTDRDVGLVLQRKGTDAFRGRFKSQRQTAMRQDWRRKKFKDQEGRCFYCGIAMMLEGAHKRQQNRCTLDHKTPLGRGGLDHWENVVACCDRCNRRKGYMTDAEFVRKQPVD